MDPAHRARLIGSLALGCTLVSAGACKQPVARPYRTNAPVATAPHTQLRVAVAETRAEVRRGTIGRAFLLPAFVPGVVAWRGADYESGGYGLASPSQMVAQDLAASGMFAHVEATTWDALQTDPDRFDLLVIVSVEQDRRRAVLWPSAGASIAGFLPMLVLGLLGVPGGTVKRQLDVAFEARVIDAPLTPVWKYAMSEESRRRAVSLIPAYQKPKGPMHARTYAAETPDLYRRGMKGMLASLSVALEYDIPEAVARARADRPPDPEPASEPDPGPEPNPPPASEPEPEQAPAPEPTSEVGADGEPESEGAEPRDETEPAAPKSEAAPDDGAAAEGGHS